MIKISNGQEENDNTSFLRKEIDDLRNQNTLLREENKRMRASKENKHLEKEKEHLYNHIEDLKTQLKSRSIPDEELLKENATLKEEIKLLLKDIAQNNSSPKPIVP